LLRDAVPLKTPLSRSLRVPHQLMGVSPVPKSLQAPRKVSRASVPRSVPFLWRGSLPHKAQRRLMRITLFLCPFFNKPVSVSLTPLQPSILPWLCQFPPTPIFPFSTISNVPLSRRECLPTFNYFSYTTPPKYRCKDRIRGTAFLIAFTFGIPLASSRIVSSRTLSLSPRKGRF